MIELFEAWIPELGALIPWARGTSNGPVAIGGVSLGALTAAVGAGDAPDQAGWRDGDIAQLGPLLEPRATSSVAGERTVVVGKSDTVTPHEGGRILARRWGVSGRNVFEGLHGHFSTPLRLRRDTKPLDRLVSILEDR